MTEIDERAALKLIAEILNEHQSVLESLLAHCERQEMEIAQLQFRLAAIHRSVV